MSAQFESLEQYLQFEEQLRRFGQEPSPEMLAEKSRLEALANPDNEEYIFSTMKARNRFMTPEKEKCVREMTDQLLREDENAAQPCLLLGKVQCGKTDTFLSIMGLCFDRGIDIVVVFTKGTTTLTRQTLQRLNKDFSPFADNGRYDQRVVIGVYDILDLNRRGYLSEYQLSDPARKHIIVCKKENTNLKYLNEMFEHNEILHGKKVLVVDDEADFASRAYYKRKNEISLLKIAENIEKFITLPRFCRYLQVTATPYSLYLQPDGTVRLRNDKEATTWLPRYTGIVPIHDKYVGGHEYYVLSEDENSMYSCLFVPVKPECLFCLSNKYEWLLENAGHRDKLMDLSYAVISYFFSTAVRSIQMRQARNELYKSSCLIHCEIEKKNHQWQEDLIIKIIEEVKTAFLVHSNADLHFLNMENNAYQSLKHSHELAVAEGLINEQFPSFEEVESKVRSLLQFNDYVVKVVNSEEPGRVAAMLDEKGQLRLEQSCNFFIGGSILDRGITINNMLCFFYGRNPKKFQMDTVLQHARMYGPRTKEDMACTRFFTTEEIYEILKTINSIDDVLRGYLIAHRDSVRSNDFTSVVMGYDNRLKPAAQNKYTPANTLVMKPSMRRVPSGFQTDEPEIVVPIVNQIEEIITHSQHYSEIDANGYFLMPYQEVIEIIRLIRSTYVYREEYNNVGLDWDINDFMTMLDNLTYEIPDESVWVRHVLDRDLGRERANTNDSRGRFVDSPLAARENRMDVEMAEDRPVLDLIRQLGRVEKGWRGTPFYWPVLVTPKNIRNKIFTINSDWKKRKPKTEIFLDTLDQYPPEEVLKLGIKRFLLFDILLGEKTEECREINSHSAPRLLMRHDTGTYMIADGCDSTKIYTFNQYNGGVFPFVLRQYKYLYLTDTRDNSGSKALVKLVPNQPHRVCCEQNAQDDIIYNAQAIGDSVSDDSLCFWDEYFDIDKVLEYKLNAQDTEIIREYQMELEEQARQNES